VLYVLGRDDNLPGYDEHFVGATSGSDLTFEYAMPNDFPNSAVAGKTLILEVKVKSVRTVKRPKVTEDFVKEHFKMDSLEEFDRYLRETLEYELSEEEKRYKESVAMDHLLGRMAVNISEDMIKDETDYLISVHERRLRAAGHSLNEMLKERNQSLDEYRQSLREEASRRLKEFLAVRAIARKKEMSVTDEEISRYTATFMRQYNVSSKDMKKLLKNREFINDAMMEIMRAKVIKHVADSAQFYYEDEEPASAPEGQADAEPPAAPEQPEDAEDNSAAQENNQDEKT
jgi:trigger factor